MGHLTCFTSVAALFGQLAVSGIMKDTASQQGIRILHSDWVISEL